MKLQDADIGIVKINAVGKAGDKRPAQLSERRSDSPTSPHERTGKTAQDQEYAILMEERYGIREEGVF